MSKTRFLKEERVVEILRSNLGFVVLRSFLEIEQQEIKLLGIVRGPQLLLVFARGCEIQEDKKRHKILSFCYEDVVQNYALTGTPPYQIVNVTEETLRENAKKATVGTFRLGNIYKPKHKELGDIFYYLDTNAISRSVPYIIPNGGPLIHEDETVEELALDDPRLGDLSNLLAIIDLSEF